MNDIRDTIADHARSMIGSPFKHQGRDPSLGIDCVGLVYASCMLSGVRVENFLGYPECPSPAVLMRELGRRFQRIARPERGDIILMKNGRDGSSRHVGILSSSRSMIVCDDPAGVRERRFFPHRMAAAFRVKEAC